MATELGKAYVQIIPSAQGISGKISSLLKGESQSAGTSSGGIIGSSLVSKLKAVVAAAGIGKAISASISEGAKLQQSIGGVETLFKESAGRVRDYAKEAYKTSGVSANEYMEGVTSFAASLLQSTAGNTKKAADVSNMAFMDMSDNANKMGTNMRDIQNAYQGFSKMNYTMLDNLKLGYGGTRSEMLRLLADAQKLTGVKYDINNLSDVYEAIHAIQGNLKITGTTALEAATTLSGSAGMMKSAFKDALGNLAIGENVKQSFSNLAETVKTFVFDNLIPMVGEIFKNIPEGLVSFSSTMGPMLIEEGSSLIDSLSQGFTTGFPKLITKAGEIITNLISGFTQNAPKLIKSGVELIKNLIQGLIDNIPLIIQKAGEIVIQLVDAFLTVAPELLSAGVELVTNLLTGLVQNLPQILSAVGEFMINLVKKIIEKAPEFAKKGKELINKLKEGMDSVKEVAKQVVVTIITAIIEFIASKASDFLTKGKELIDKIKEGFNAKKDEVKQAITNIISSVLDFIKSKAGEFLNKGKELIGKLKEAFNQKKTDVVNAGKKVIEDTKKAIENFRNKFVEVGSNIISGIAQGIRDGIKVIASAAKDAANKALSAAKKALGIKSPSRVFAKEVGKFIPEGMAKGISDNLKVVDTAVKRMIKRSLYHSNGEKIIQGLATGLTVKFPVVNSVVNGFGPILQSTLNKNIKLFNKSGQNIVESVNNGIKSTSNKVSNSLKSTADKGIETLTDNMANFSVAGNKISIAIKEGIGNQGITIVIQIGDIIKEGLDKVDSFQSKMTNAGENIVKKLKEGTEKKKGSFINTLKNIMDEGLKVVKYMTSKIKLVMDSVFSSSVQKTFSKAAPILIENSRFKPLAQVANIGKNIVAGYNQGMQRGTSSVIKTAKKVIDKTVGFFKDRLKINSPSKVFEEIGSYVTEGFSIGILSNIKPVKKAITEIEDASSLNITKDFIGRKKYFNFTNEDSFKINDEEDKNRPINLNLNIGGKSFRAFTDLISTKQDEKIDLDLAY